MVVSLGVRVHNYSIISIRSFIFSNDYIFPWRNYTKVHGLKYQCIEFIVLDQIFMDYL